MLALIVGLSIVAFALLVATRYYPAYGSALGARGDLRAAQALLKNHGLDTTEADLAKAEALLDDAERGFHRARQAFDDPLMWIGQRLPLVGGSVKATVVLTEIGLEGSRLGQDAVAITRTYQRVRDEGGGTLTERAGEILSEVEPSMSAIKSRLSRIRGKQEQVASASLLPDLASAFREIDADLAELDEAVRNYDDLAAFVPDLLGFNGRRSYLVLAQNNAELLPTGGLISVYGFITIQDGRIQEQYFQDAISYATDWRQPSDSYIEPPAPLKRYLLKNFTWNLSVSNWSPHFPSAAQEAERFFRLAGGPEIDGVIAINVHTIEELLRVTGPVAVESYGVTVTAENAFDVIEEHTRLAQEGQEQVRKAFVGLLADELLSRLMRAPPEQWTPLLDALGRLRDQRQLFLFSHVEEMQLLAQRLGLDGSLESVAGDYLMLVDASVNSTKLNIALDQRVDLTVWIDAQGVTHHEVTVSYRNNLPLWAAGRDPLLVRRLMLSGLYGDYLRLLTPHGSQLESVTMAGDEVGPEEISVEQGKAVFGRFFALPSGQEIELVFRYSTLDIVQVEDDGLVYNLYLQKQSGTAAIPVTLQIILPDSAQLGHAELDNEPIDSLAHIETDLAQDREISIGYELDR